MNNKTEDFQSLSILEALEKDRNLSQRGIARNTGMNLATVNYCLKRLVEKGFVKLKNVSRSHNKLRYLYIITPEGIWEKSRLTYNFIQRTYAQFRLLEERVGNDLENMINIGHGLVAVYGTGEVAEMMIRIINNIQGMKVVAVVDGKGGTLKGYPVRPVETLAGENYDLVILCDPKKREELARAVEREKIWILGQPLNNNEK